MSCALSFRTLFIPHASQAHTVFVNSSYATHLLATWFACLYINRCVGVVADAAVVIVIVVVVK